MPTDIKTSLSKDYRHIVVSWQGVDKRDGVYIPITDDDYNRIKNIPMDKLKLILFDGSTKIGVGFINSDGTRSAFRVDMPKELYGW